MRISSELVPHKRQRIHSVSQLFQPLIQVFRLLGRVYKIMILNLCPRSMYFQIGQTLSHIPLRGSCHGNQVHTGKILVG